MQAGILLSSANSYHALSIYICQVIGRIRMPQKSAPELFAAIHYLHRLSTEGKRGAKMALKLPQVSFHHAGRRADDH